MAQLAPQDLKVRQAAQQVQPGQSDQLALLDHWEQLEQLALLEQPEARAEQLVLLVQPGPLVSPAQLAYEEPLAYKGHKDCKVYKEQLEQLVLRAAAEPQVPLEQLA